MSVFAAKADGMAIKNDALRDAFALDGTRCFLLKRAGQTKAFSLIGSELTSGFLVQFDENRSESGLFQYASSQAFEDTWAQSTHVAYGVPDDDDLIEVFEFVEGEKDTINPDGFSPFWSGRIRKVENERYEVT